MAPFSATAGSRATRPQGHPLSRSARTTAAGLAATAGGIAVIALLAWFGARRIGAEIFLAAWTIPLLVGLHGTQLLLSALVWRRLCAADRPGRLRWWLIRWVREAVNSMLPVAQIGGNVVGIRLLAASGVAQVQAASGTVLDVAVEAVCLAVFTIAAIAVLALTQPDLHALPWVAGSAAALVAGSAGLLLALRLGALRLIEALAVRLGRLVPGLDLAGLHRAFGTLQRNRQALATGFAVHLLSYVLGTGETLMALAAMGHLPSLGAAFVVEALGLAARNAAFAVPAGLGVQEAGYIAVGALFGLPAPVCIALSMLKRARELTVGVGGLLAWQRLEIAAGQMAAAGKHSAGSALSQPTGNRETTR